VIPVSDWRNRDVRKQIRNFLFVFGGGIGAAFLLAVFLVMHYGPQGYYEVATVLLSPKLLHELNYNDTNPKTGGFDRFVFDSIQFSYLEPSLKKWQNVPVDEKRYAQFYALIKSEKSVLDPDNQLERAFLQGSISKLTLRVKTESSAAWQALTKVFQEVQFAQNGADFRIQLHEQNPGEHWAYFQRPGIGTEVRSLFVEKP